MTVNVDHVVELGLAGTLGSAAAGGGGEGPRQTFTGPCHLAGKATHVDVLLLFDTREIGGAPSGQHLVCKAQARQQRKLSMPRIAHFF